MAFLGSSDVERLPSGSSTRKRESRLTSKLSSQPVRKHTSMSFPKCICAFGLALALHHRTASTTVSNAARIWLTHLGALSKACAKRDGLLQRLVRRLVTSRKAPDQGCSGEPLLRSRRGGDGRHPARQPDALPAGLVIGSSCGGRLVALRAPAVRNSWCHRFHAGP